MGFSKGMKQCACGLITCLNPLTVRCFFCLDHAIYIHDHSTLNWHIKCKRVILKDDILREAARLYYERDK